MLACSASFVWAQDSKDAKAPQSWELQGIRAGYCVRFLIEPRSASGMVPGGLRLVPAGQDSALHSALRDVIRSQPEFAAWSASSLCFYFADAVQVGARRIIEKDP